MPDFFDHIISQPAVLIGNLEKYWQETRQIAGECRRLRKNGIKQVVLTGMGASYFATIPAFYFLAKHGILVRVEETGSLYHYALGTLDEETILIIVSRSGESVEIKQLLDKLPARRPIVIGITENREGYLSLQSDYFICTAAGDDPPVALKTYLTSMALLFILSVNISGDDGSVWLNKIEEAIEGMSAFIKGHKEIISQAVEYLGSFANITLLGRGPSLASALEGALLFQEGVRLPAAGYSGWQFRHGGVEIVEPGFCAVLFTPAGSTQLLQKRLVNELHAYGGRLLVIGSDLLMSPGHTISLKNTDEFLAPLVEIIPVQLLVYHYAMEKGISLGVFRNAANVVTKE